VKLVVSDAITACATRSPACSERRGKDPGALDAQRTRAQVPKGQHTMVAAAIRQALLQPDAPAAHQIWRPVADQFRSRWPKLAALMDESEHDVLACMDFPAQHCDQAAGTNPLERLNNLSEWGQIFRLIGAVLLEQNDECVLQHGYISDRGYGRARVPERRRPPVIPPPQAA
jgi:putative transposase